MTTKKTTKNVRKNVYNKKKTSGRKFLWYFQRKEKRIKMALNKSKKRRRQQLHK